MEIRKVEDRFKRTMSIVNRLNEKCNHNVFSQEEVQEQFNNLEDFDRLLHEYDKLIQSFDNINNITNSEVDEKLAELHYILNTYIWHIDELHSLVVKMFKGYNSNIID